MHQFYWLFFMQLSFWLYWKWFQLYRYVSGFGSPWLVIWTIISKTNVIPCNDNLCNISDINECHHNTSTCHSNAECSNSIGSYNCNCDTGFIGNGMNCKGILSLYLIKASVYRSVANT